MPKRNGVAPTLRDLSTVLINRSLSNLVRSARSQGLSMIQFHTLMRVYKQGDCSVSDVGEQMGVTNAAASQMIDRLVVLDLLARSEDPNDRRAKLLRLTNKGRGLVEKCMAARDQWLEDLPKCLTPERQAAVETALGYLMEAAQKLDDRQA